MSSDKDGPKSEDDWQSELTPEQFRICRQKGTEPPFSGDLLHNKLKGHYDCVCCDNRLFDSGNKYDSGSGWPSFWEVHGPDSIIKRTDTGHGMVREEVVCARCKSHLGHVFDDGPKPTGLRYCINSVALKFVQEQ